MFTSKERSALRSLAQSLTPVTQVGKGGVNENMLKLLSDALDARELIKISVLQSVEEGADIIADKLAEGLNAEIVCVTGRKIVFYRKSSRSGIRHVDFSAAKTAKATRTEKTEMPKRTQKSQMTQSPQKSQKSQKPTKTAPRIASRGKKDIHNSASGMLKKDIAKPKH